MDWLTGAIAFIFLGLLDTIAYGLVEAVYALFVKLADLSFFGGSVAEAMNMYNNFTARVYTILGIAMVFFFAYQLILMIVDPDGNAKNQTSGIIKNTAVSLIAICLCPLIFKYMAVFQTHVLTSNTIPALVLGSGAASSGEIPGKSLSMIIMTAMYHPVGTTYSTFMDPKTGAIRTYDEVSDLCSIQSDHDLCVRYYKRIAGWACFGAKQENQPDMWERCQKLKTDGTIQTSIGLATLTHDLGMHKEIGNSNGMEYFWVFSTICALAVTWFLLSYCLDMGTRAVKLAFLEIIAPIPLAMRIFPKTKSTFDKWFKEITKTYLDVFLRVLIISFIIELCILVPQFIDVIF